MKIYHIQVLSFFHHFQIFPKVVKKMMFYMSITVDVILEYNNHRLIRSNYHDHRYRTPIRRS